MARPSRKDTILPAIFAVGCDLIAKEGLLQLTIAKIAKAAGISVGTIYLYPSKEKMIEGMFQTLQLQMEEKILRDYDPKGSPKARFTTLFLNVCDYYKAHPSHFLFFDAIASSISKAGIETLSRKTQEAFVALYRDSVATGTVKAIRLETMTSVIHGPIVSLMKKHHNGVLDARKETLDELKDCIWDGIRKA